MSINRIVRSLVWLFTSLTGVAQTETFKIFLIGDAGDDEMTTQTLDSLQTTLSRNPNSAVFFLGDNSYRNAPLLPIGFKGFDSSMVTQRKVGSELALLNGYKGSAYFVPGNHDWWNTMNFKRGKPRLKLEENFIEQNLALNKTIQNPNNTFIPKNGSPGPEAVELNHGKIKVISIDTYWLIMLQFKQNPAENRDYEKVFYHNLDSIIGDASSKQQKVMIVCHHPVYYQRYRKPPPIWMVPRRVGMSDLSFPSYKRMCEQITTILKKYPGIYFASGHMHAIQYHHTPDNIHYIISGAGSRLINVPAKTVAQAKANTGKDCIFWNDKGFFEVTFYNDHEDITIYHDEGRKKVVVSELGGK